MVLYKVFLFSLWTAKVRHISEHPKYSVKNFCSQPLYPSLCYMINYHEYIMEKFQEIIQSEKPVLVDFFATWCGPCKMMHPILEDLHAKVGDKARIIKVDIDKNEHLASIYNVRSVPTLIIFRDGEVKWRGAGVTSALELEEKLSQFYV